MLTAAREKLAARGAGKVIVVFQPHIYNRTIIIDDTIHDFHTCCLRIIHPCSRHSYLIPGKSDIQQIRRTFFIVHAGASICLIRCA